MTLPFLLSLMLLGQAQGSRPRVDRQAMKEAMSQRAGSLERFSSAAAYAHYLKARLMHHTGDHRGAVNELRLALASDDQNAFLMTELAEEYARLGELSRAEDELKAVLDHHPTNADAQLLMGRVLMEGNKPVPARAALRSAIKLRPHDTDAYLVLTQLWLDLGKVDEAMKVVEELSTALPGEPMGYKRLGLALAEREDHVRAERLLTHAVERDPGDTESLRALAQIYEATGRLAKSEAVLGQALERDPDSREVLLALGRVALRQEAYVRARGYFDQLLFVSKDPEWAAKAAFSYLAMHRVAEAGEILDKARKEGHEPRLHFYAGLIYERLHEWQRAQAAYGEITSDTGDLFHEARLHQAFCLSSLGKHSAALDLYKKAIDAKPESVSLILAYARGLERAKKHREAEALLAKVANEHPGADTREAFANFLERNGRASEAISVLLDGLRTQPRDEALLFALASVYERSGEVHKSLEKMRTVLEINPDNANALNFIGYILADRGLDFDEAERLVSRALELKPDTAAYLDSLGWVFFRKGDVAKAVMTLERATEFSPGEPTIEEHLGDAYAMSRRTREAADRYQRALRALKEAPDLAESASQKTLLEKKLKALEK